MSKDKIQRTRSIRLIFNPDEDKVVEATKQTVATKQAKATEQAEATEQGEATEKAVDAVQVTSKTNTVQIDKGELKHQVNNGLLTTHLVTNRAIQELEQMMWNFLSLFPYKDVMQEFEKSVEIHNKRIEKAKQSDISSEENIKKIEEVYITDEIKSKYTTFIRRMFVNLWIGVFHKDNLPNYLKNKEGTDNYEYTAKIGYIYTDVDDQKEGWYENSEWYRILQENVKLALPDDKEEQEKFLEDCIPMFWTAERNDCIFVNKRQLAEKTKETLFNFLWDVCNNKEKDFSGIYLPLKYKGVSVSDFLPKAFNYSKSISKEEFRTNYLKIYEDIPLFLSRVLISKEDYKTAISQLFGFKNNIISFTNFNASQTISNLFSRYYGEDMNKYIADIMNNTSENFNDISSKAVKNQSQEKKASNFHDHILKKFNANKEKFPQKDAEIFDYIIDLFSVIDNDLQNKEKQDSPYREKQLERVNEKFLDHRRSSDKFFYYFMESLLPLSQPSSLNEETTRNAKYNNDLMTFKDFVENIKKINNSDEQRKDWLKSCEKKLQQDPEKTMHDVLKEILVNFKEGQTEYEKKHSKPTNNENTFAYFIMYYLMYISRVEWRAEDLKQKKIGKSGVFYYSVFNKVVSTIDASLAAMRNVEMRRIDNNSKKEENAQKIKEELAKLQEEKSDENSKLLENQENEKTLNAKDCFSELQEALIEKSIINNNKSVSMLSKLEFKHFLKEQNKQELKKEDFNSLHKIVSSYVNNVDTLFKSVITAVTLHDPFYHPVPVSYDNSNLGNPIKCTEKIENTKQIKVKYHSILLLREKILAEGSLHENSKENKKQQFLYTLKPQNFVFTSNHMKKEALKRLKGIQNNKEKRKEIKGSFAITEENGFFTYESSKNNAFKNDTAINFMIDKNLSSKQYDCYNVDISTMVKNVLDKTEDLDINSLTTYNLSYNFNSKEKGKIEAVKTY